MSQTTTERSRERETEDPGPELPAVQMHLHTPREPGVGRVVKTERCTGRKSAAFIRHIEIDVSKTHLAGKIRAGQSVGVLAPGENEKGRPHSVRLYSISSPSAGEDGSGNVLSTAVKRVVDEHWETHKLFVGTCSNYLCDLQEGDEVMVTGPAGKRFLVPERAGEHDYVFVATGTGIAPFRGMVKDLLAAGVQSRIVLIMGSPYKTDLIYDDEFRRLDAEHENFTYLTAISRERQDDGGKPLYVQKRLTTHRDLIEPLLTSDRALVYLCGLTGLELGVFQEMARLLSPEKLARYLRVDPEVAGDVDGWDRKMVSRQLRPTRRMMLEVY